MKNLALVSILIIFLILGFTSKTNSQTFDTIKGIYKITNIAEEVFGYHPPKASHSYMYGEFAKLLSRENFNVIISAMNVDGFKWFFRYTKCLNPEEYLEIDFDKGNYLSELKKEANVLPDISKITFKTYDDEYGYTTEIYTYTDSNGINKKLVVLYENTQLIMVKIYQKETK